MELRQLQYLVQAGELLNFTEAARRLHITQSTLSQQIKQLEVELGTPLFDRIGKRVQLTEAGRQLLIYARQTLASAASGLHALQDLAELRAGALTIGATYALRARLTPALLRFATSYPDIHLTLLYGTSDALLEQLCASQLDFVLTFQHRDIDARLASQPLFESPLALVVAPSSPLATRTRMTLPEIADLRLALPVQGYSTRQFLDAAFAAYQIRPRICIEVNDMPTLFQLVETGHWSTILTLATVDQQHSVVTIPLEGEGMRREARVVWLKERYRKQAARRFCELVG
ncbi:MAG: LysR family transcriptional regulator [Chloroflexales bacterium]|nr:LysR family transcriptional regulator [Chloroflexales bacterium]